MALVIRKIDDKDDKEAISVIYAAAWKFAYRGIVPDGYLDSLADDRWVGLLKSSELTSFVMLQNGIYIGTSAVAVSSNENLPQVSEQAGEIVSIYLLPQFMRLGYGTKLLKAVLDELKNEGCKTVVLWVLRENSRAINFYKKNGFKDSNETKTLDIGGKELLTVKFLKEL